MVVSELITLLQSVPQEARVLIEDPDTLWTITDFKTRLDSKRNEFWIEPDGYDKMHSVWPPKAETGS